MAFGHQKLTVDATVRSLTVPSDVNFAQVKVETAAIRYRLDGTDPATAEGVLVSKYGCVVWVNTTSRIKIIYLKKNLRYQFQNILSLKTARR